MRRGVYSQNDTGNFLERRKAAEAVVDECQALEDEERFEEVIAVDECSMIEDLLLLNSLVMHKRDYCFTSEHKRALVHDGTDIQIRMLGYGSTSLFKLIKYELLEFPTEMPAHVRTAADFINSLDGSSLPESLAGTPLEEFGDMCARDQFTVFRDTAYAERLMRCLHRSIKLKTVRGAVALLILSVYELCPEVKNPVTSRADVHLTLKQFSQLLATLRGVYMLFDAANRHSLAFKSANECRTAQVFEKVLREYTFNVGKRT